jgi:tRNA (guanine26-N2/guanine27-N2)-dimethyltransferase
LRVLTIIGKKNSRNLLQRIEEKLVEIMEGTTKILIPEKSLDEKVPPKEPAFFNPAAKLNRDFSILAYSTFWENFDKPKIFLDGLAGLGARSLRVANEIPDVETVVANDINSEGLNIALDSMKLNKISKLDISEKEICQFFGSYSKKGKRGSIVDVDPFGSPTKYFDCAIRATMHGGMLSVTATDLQVLHGLSKRSCQRKYHGVPIKTEYSNEIAIRLILGCLEYVAGRLDIQIIPQFVQHDMHYYRAYVKILNRPGQKEQLGYIIHCKSCGRRKASMKKPDICKICDCNLDVAGPLWIGQLFEKEFVMKMNEMVPKLTVDKRCEKILEKCILESEMPPIGPFEHAPYYTLDEVASKMQKAPLKMKNMIKKLQDAGYLATPTSLNPTGFRTDCTIDKIIKLFKN